MTESPFQGGSARFPNPLPAGVGGPGGPPPLWGGGGGPGDAGFPRHRGGRAGDEPRRRPDVPRRRGGRAGWPDADGARVEAPTQVGTLPVRASATVAAPPEAGVSSRPESNCRSTYG